MEEALQNELRILQESERKSSATTTRNDKSGPIVDDETIQPVESADTSRLKIRIYPSTPVGESNIPASETPRRKSKNRRRPKSIRKAVLQRRKLSKLKKSPSKTSKSSKHNAEVIAVVPSTTTVELSSSSESRTELRESKIESEIELVSQETLPSTGLGFFDHANMLRTSPV